jgi:ABC-2 type transport system ATP-binding protein
MSEPQQASASEHVRSEVPRLLVEHVAKTYVTHGLWPLTRRVPVLTDASLEILPGEVAALVGGNGSGKSTLMMIIAGTLARDAGTVTVDGRIGYCPQTPVLYEKLTVAETFRLFGVAYGLSATEVSVRKAELLGTLAFGHYDDFRVEHLSGGTKQKLNLALALLHDPEVLLLDEPYAGFDYETYLRFWEMSTAMVARGRAVLIVSHFVEDRARFDRIYRVADGVCHRDQ